MSRASRRARSSGSSSPPRPSDPIGLLFDVRRKRGSSWRGPGDSHCLALALLPNLRLDVGAALGLLPFGDLDELGPLGGRRDGDLLACVGHAVALHDFLLVLAGKFANLDALANYNLIEDFGDRYSSVSAQVRLPTV